MSTLTLSGQLSTDPFFDPHSLRSDRYDWHETEATIEDHEPVEGTPDTISYRIFFRYDDEGHSEIQRIEALNKRTSEDYLRGRAATSRILDTSDPIQAALVALFWADSKSEHAQREIADAVAKHQRDRDDESEAADSRYAA